MPKDGHLGACGLVMSHARSLPTTLTGHGSVEHLEEEGAKHGDWWINTLTFGARIGSLGKEIRWKQVAKQSG